MSLPDFRNIFTRLVSIGVINCCIFLTSFQTHAAQHNEPQIANQTDSSTSTSVLTDNQEKENNTSQAWAAFVPPPDKFDWIQLTSGEWLKGELNFLYDDKLEFDSDELDLLTLDWKDVKQVRGHGIKGVRLEGPISVYGTLKVIDDKVIVTTGKLEQVFERNKLVTITHGDQKESNYWSAKISLGLNFTGGNTEQVDYSSIINIKRHSSASQFVLDFLGNFSQSRGIDTVDNKRLTGSYDLFKTRKYFIRVLFGEYFRDPFQNIEHRDTIGAGIGYNFIDTPKTDLNVTPGLAFQYTQFVSVEPGQDLTTSTPALVVNTLYDTELTKTIDFKVNYTFNIVNKTSGSYTHHAIASVETELLSWLDFDVSFVWDRIKNPTANADGTVPKQDDYQLIFSLGLDY